MDTLRQGAKIEIKGADDNTRMVSILLMKPNKMFSINGEEHTLMLNRKCKHGFIRECKTGTTTFVSRHDIMTEVAQF
jgi:hypothetical protein